MKNGLALMMLSGILIISGCGNDKAENLQDGNAYESSQSTLSSENNLEKNKKDTFNIIKETSYTENIFSIIKKFQEHRGFVEYTTGKEHYIIIFAGKKDGLGYGLDVLQAYDKGDTAKIIIKENKIKDDNSKSSQVSYPSMVIKVSKVFNDLDISTDDGEKLNQIKDNNINSQ